MFDRPGIHGAPGFLEVSAGPKLRFGLIETSRDPGGSFTHPKRQNA